MGKKPVDLVVLTVIHGDHLNIETPEAVLTEGADLVVPKAVEVKLPDTVKARAHVMHNGKMDVVDFSLEAIPMYNLPESGDSFHTKGLRNS